MAMATLDVPVPPLRLRSITAAPEEDVFLWTGAADLGHLLGIYERCVGERPAKPRVLDFGCGCGRLTRHLDASRYEGIACDLNPDHVAWCRANIPFVETRTNRAAPPLPFGDRSVDFVIALSVFTHLPESAGLEWLADLRRVLRPGGLVAITTHGYPALDIIIPSAEHHQMFNVDEAGARALKARLPRDGYVHLPYSAEVVALANVGIPYGNSFIDPAHAARTWANVLEPVEHQPGGLRGWHDIHVLRRRD